MCIELVSGQSHWTFSPKESRAGLIARKAIENDNRNLGAATINYTPYFSWEKGLFSVGADLPLSHFVEVDSSINQVALGNLGFWVAWRLEKSSLITVGTRVPLAKSSDVEKLEAFEWGNQVSLENKDAFYVDGLPISVAYSAQFKVLERYSVNVGVAPLYMIQLNSDSSKSNEIYIKSNLGFGYGFQHFFMELGANGIAYLNKIDSKEGVYVDFYDVVEYRRNGLGLGFLLKIPVNKEVRKDFRLVLGVNLSYYFGKAKEY